MTVTVNDVNEPPEFNSGSRSEFSYRENGTAALYTFRATDPERATIAWSLAGDDRDDFDMSVTGVLTFASIPDFEAPADANRDNDYSVTVVASDGSNNATLGVTVTVTNYTGPEEPTITTSSNPSPFQENSTRTVYTFRARDPQGRPVTWSLQGDDANDFSITSTGALTFVRPPDFENPSDSGRDNAYVLTVIATDHDFHADRISFTITVTDVNEGPEVTSGGDSFTVQENRNWPGATFTAADPEGSAVTHWSLGGRDGGDFTISSDGLLTFRNVPDYERPDDADKDNLYEVEVRPYDGRYYRSQHITVNT